MLRHFSVVRDDGGNTTGHDRTMGFGNECSEDVNVSETTSKILTHKEKSSACSRERVLCLSMLQSYDPNLKVGRVENYRDETSVRVRKGRIGLGVAFKRRRIWNNGG